jgi:hypothetical protein
VARIFQLPLLLREAARLGMVRGTFQLMHAYAAAYRWL